MFHMWIYQRVVPKSSILIYMLIGFPIIDHPFWGTPFMETPHIEISTWGSSIFRPPHGCKSLVLVFSGWPFWLKKWPRIQQLQHLLSSTWSGWWLSHPSEKYEFVNWDDDIPNIWENKKWQPNHQPVMIWGYPHLRKPPFVSSISWRCNQLAPRWPAGAASWVPGRPPGFQGPVGHQKSTFSRKKMIHGIDMNIRRSFWKPLFDWMTSNFRCVTCLKSEDFEWI